MATTICVKEVGKSYSSTTLHFPEGARGLFILDVKRKFISIVRARDGEANTAGLEEGQLKFLYDGRLVDNALPVEHLEGAGSYVMLHAVVSSNEVDLRNLLSPVSPATSPSHAYNSFSTPVHVSPVLDAQSAQAAAALLSAEDSRAVLSPEQHAHLMLTLAALASGHSNVVPAPTPAVAQRAVAAPVEPPLRLFDAFLFLRLAIGFALFSQGLSAQRMAVFFALAVLYYTFEVGLVTLLLKRSLAWVVQLQQQRQPGGGAAGPHDPRLANQANNAFIADMSVHFHVPQRPGLLLDLWALLLSLTCSLFPSWKVQADAPAPRPLPPNPAHDRVM